MTMNEVWDAACKYDIDWMVVFLIATLGFMARCLYRLHRDKLNVPNFDLTGLVMEIGPDGKTRISKIGFAWMVTLFMTTWVVIRLTLRGQLTEGYFQAYLAAWVAPLVAYVIWGHKPPPPPEKPNG